MSIELSTLVDLALSCEKIKNKIFIVNKYEECEIENVFLEEGDIVIEIK